MEDNHWEG